MKNLLILPVIGFVLATASAAFGATDIGVIKSINPKGDAIILEDGKTFVLAEGTEAESLKVGEKVKITFKSKAGKMVATKVEIAK